LGPELVDRARPLLDGLRAILRECSDEDKVEALNWIRADLAKESPFSSEPVDCVQWVPLAEVQANDYNPNKVAKAEMELLAHSIRNDGYTQPVVVWRSDGYEVVDGFHRSRVAREIADIGERVNGYLPVVVLSEDRTKRNDRMASTIRHNRARGKHVVSNMSEIVVELRKRNWSEKRIGKELGMQPDEVLRLAQISGIESLFSDTEYSEAWE
jgi:ParB-like chromosome segregation protein Spo0J